MTSIDVAIVDDQPLLVGAFTALITAQPDMEVVLSATNGRQAVEALRAAARERHGADVVLMDLRMPVLDGVSAIRALRDEALTASVRILVLTTFDDEDLVLASLRAGADGFVLKDTEPAALLAAVRALAQGRSWLDPAITATVLRHLDGSPQEVGPPASGGAGAPSSVSPSAPSAPMAWVEPLTEREQAVLALVCQGLSNAQVAERLLVAESTVKSHVKAVLGKTGCRNRVELVVHAFTTGLLPREGMGGAQSS